MLESECKSATNKRRESPPSLLLAHIVFTLTDKVVSTSLCLLCVYNQAQPIPKPVLLAHSGLHRLYQMMKNLKGVSLDGSDVQAAVSSDLLSLPLPQTINLVSPFMQE